MKVGFGCILVHVHHKGFTSKDTGPFFTRHKCLFPTSPCCPSCRAWLIQKSTCPFLLFLLLTLFSSSFTQQPDLVPTPTHSPFLSAFWNGLFSGCFSDGIGSLLVPPTPITPWYGQRELNYCCFPVPLTVFIFSYFYFYLISSFFFVPTVNQFYQLLNTLFLCFESLEIILYPVVP